MAEQKQNNSGVVITVYVESSTSRSKKSSDHTIKKTKSQPHSRRPRTAARQGYDRRAQLLAYSRQLRNAAPEDALDQFFSKKLKPKAKICIWLRRICSPSIRMIRRSGSRWRYERMTFKESEEINRSDKKKATSGNSSPFLRKVKTVLREMSCKEIKW